MTIRTDYPYQNLQFWVNGGDPVLDVWLGYTPLDAEQRTNRTFGYLSVKKPKIPGPHPCRLAVHHLVHRRHLQRGQGHRRAGAGRLDAQGADWNNEVFPAIRDLRALLARCGSPKFSTRRNSFMCKTRSTAARSWPRFNTRPPASTTEYCPCRSFSFGRFSIV